MVNAVWSARPYRALAEVRQEKGLMVDLTMQASRVGNRTLGVLGHSLRLPGLLLLNQGERRTKAGGCCNGITTGAWRSHRFKEV